MQHGEHSRVEIDMLHRDQLTLYTYLTLALVAGFVGICVAFVLNGG